ncbi:helix-turn-helix domain-containing protein [Alkalihalobacterium elongatum]|uniref:helix-turn-helix domain-containing protein n=1 Tax=Alkalihalobacterium elongatum TaxID=2675466 RepID=UPI001C1FDE26|nr:helix-turn-helix transcriptional regulator [Alkalihalobacterium elongatum]
MIGETIKKYRVRKGLTLAELAKRAGVDKSYLSSIEEKIYLNPSLQFFEKVSPILGISVDNLLKECAKEAFDPVWNDVVDEALEAGLTTEEYIDFLEYTKAQEMEPKSPKPSISYQLKTFCRESTKAKEKIRVI